jgi:hypothetical protein
MSSKTECTFFFGSGLWILSFGRSVLGDGPADRQRWLQRPHTKVAAQIADSTTAPARPDRGDAWEPPTGEPDEDAPTDGRQLLGWASKQIPDLKGALIGWGKKKGLASKIVQWTPQQVAAAYRFARARSTR